MIYNAKLILEDGSFFFGNFFGSEPENAEVGEVVFNTSMVGYQEILTDPSYCEQIVCLTYPLIGNYGISKKFNESSKPFCKGLIIRDLCDFPKHFLNTQTLNDFLIEQELTCIKDVDTRALTKKLREHGTIKGKIISINEMDDSTMDQLKIQKTVDSIKNTVLHSQVKTVSRRAMSLHKSPDAKKNVVLIDYGAKENILQSLLARNLNVAVVPYNTSFEEIAEIAPDGICLSNGPGDPEDLKHEIEVVKKLQDKFPVFGICLGHQLICLANGAKTSKMLYGHRGGNHPVQDLETGKVYMSSQNHGYVVESETLSQTDLKPWFINVNDKTIEGVKHSTKPVISVQFHPEFKPGPRDTNYLFDNFLEML